MTAAKTPPPCRFCGQSQEHHAPDCTRPVVHGSGLSAAPPPPFVRFERLHAASFMVWIAAPPHDAEDVNAAMNTPEGRAMSAVRVLVDFFGYELPPAEDALLTRYVARDTGAGFWAAVEAAGLMYTAPTDAYPAYPPLSARTKALALRLGFVAIENTVARSPLTLTADLRYGAGPLATAAQKAITAVFVKNFAAARCPTSGLVTASFAEISDLLGYGERGGWQYEHIRDLVRGLRGAGVGGEWVTHDGDTTDDWYGIIQASRVTTKDAGSVTVRLTYDFQKSIRAARFTYLENEQVRRLNQASPRSDIPLNFWYFLQSQKLPWPHGWPIFRAPEGATQSPAGVRPLAEILGLHSKNHRKTVQRIRAAANVIMAVFPEYSITVKPTKVATMYRMFATRRAVLGAPVDNSEEDAESVYEEGTAPCMSGVQAGVRAGYSESDEMPAPTEGNEAASVFKIFQSERDQSERSRDTRNGFPVGEPEQPIDHNEDAEGQEKWLGAKNPLCTPETLVAQMTQYPDERYEHKGEATLRDLLEGSRVTGARYGPAGVPLIEALALAVCEQFRNASGGAVCHGNDTGNGIWAAEHLVDGGEVEWCPAWDALSEVGFKIREYLGKRGQVKGSPAQYVFACIKRAAADPTELMGRTREESKAAYAEMRRLDKRPAAVAPPKMKGID